MEATAASTDRCDKVPRPHKHIRVGTVTRKAHEETEFEFFLRHVEDKGCTCDDFFQLDTFCSSELNTDVTRATGISGLVGLGSHHESKAKIATRARLGFVVVVSRLSYAGMVRQATRDNYREDCAILLVQV